VYWRIVRDYNLTVAATATDIVHFPLRVAFNNPLVVTPGFPYQPEPGVVRAKNPNGTPMLDAGGKQVFRPNYDEVYLGEYTPSKYYASNLKSGLAGALGVFLVGNTTTANGTNDLLLDYIKLVPVL
jgi:hypothetical protein